MNRLEFIELIMQIANLPNELDAERIAVTVLHVLKSQLNKHEKNNIHNTLPTDILELWEGGLLQELFSRILSLQVMNKDSFIEQTREIADLKTKEEAENYIKAVFIALKATIPHREIEHISQILPDEVKELWDAA